MGDPSSCADQIRLIPIYRRYLCHTQMRRINAQKSMAIPPQVGARVLRLTIGARQIDTEHGRAPQKNKAIGTWTPHPAETLQNHCQSLGSISVVFMSATDGAGAKRVAIRLLAPCEFKRF